MDNYNVGEVYQFAVRIEENGQKVYNYFAQKFIANREVSELFASLAKQEANHKNIFEDMVEEMLDYSLNPQYPDDYFLYIRAFADNVLFNEKDMEKENISTVEEALDFAIKKELDTINYYNTLQNFVNSEHHDKIFDIIKEEQKHFLRLVDIKENLH